MRFAFDQRVPDVLTRSAVCPLCHKRELLTYIRGTMQLFRPAKGEDPALFGVLTPPFLHSYWFFNISTYSKTERAEQERKLTSEFKTNRQGCIPVLIIGPCKAEPGNERYNLYLSAELEWPGDTDSSTAVTPCLWPFQLQLMGYA